MSATPSTPPTKRPVAFIAASVIALVLIGIAFVAIRDLAVAQSWTTGTPWVPQLVDAVDGLTAGTAVLVAGVVAALVGLLLIWTVLRPATRTHQRAGVKDADVWISSSAVATVAREAADRTPGVLSAEARARKRRVDVTVTASDAAGSDVEGRVEQTVRIQLEGLDDRNVKVRLKEASA